MKAFEDACALVKGLRLSSLEELADAYDAASSYMSESVTSGDTIAVIEVNGAKELFITTMSGLVLRGTVVGD